MNIYLNISTIKNANNIIDLRDDIRYLYPKKNTIMEGEFTKILFSKNNITMNGLYLYLPLSVDTTTNNNHTKNNYNKNKNEIYIRNLARTSLNNQIISDLKQLEKSILNHYIEYTKCGKPPEYILNKQLLTNQIRVYHDNYGIKKKNKYVIKISGIWETNCKMGLTYKIMEL